MEKLFKSCTSGWPCLTLSQDLLLSFLFAYVFCPFVFYRYHRLMVRMYGNKRGKALAAKGWAAKESMSVWETERVMDVELFLKGQTKREKYSPHHLVMLYKMFMHAADKGRKEVEWTVCWGCQQELPKLDPEADVPTIQLVDPQTMRDEIQSLYLEVYKQQRLPGSPPREPELTEEVASSFEDHQGQKKEETSGAIARPWPTDAQPMRSRTPGRGRRETSVERSFAMVREAHQKMLATGAALEGEIERLSCSLPQSQPEVSARSKSRDFQGHRTMERKRRHCQVWLEGHPAPYHPSRKSLETSEETAAAGDLDLEEPPELEPEVACFLGG